MTTKIYINNPDSSGVSLYRTYWPWLHCREAMAAQGIELVAGGPATGIPPTAEHDVFFFGRTPKPSEVPLFYFLHKQGKRVIWDLEDNYLRIPETFSCYKVSKEVNTEGVLSMSLDIADHVTVITQALADFITAECPYTAGHVTVLPNLIDADAYRIRPSRGTAHRPRVLWAGGNSHGPDLAAIAEVFARIVAETEMEIVLLGDYPTIPEAILRLPPDRCVIHGWSSARHYPAALCNLQPDVGIIPITGTEFDAGKSAIKWMEYSLAGAAVVATDYGPYRAELEHDRTALLVPVANDPDAWFTAIQKAYVHRRELQAAAKETVLARHSWQSPEARRPWLEFFAEQAQLVQPAGA